MQRIPPAQRNVPVSLEFWYMFPISILVSTIAMATGVEGATFFSPIFMLLLRLPPDVAIGAGLITQLFGFASGLSAYHRKKIIDYQLGTSLLVVTIPLALAGTWLSSIIDPSLLKFTLGIGLLGIGGNFLRSPLSLDVNGESEVLARSSSRVRNRSLFDATGEEIRYPECNRTEGRILAGIGGLFTGMVATGLGQLNGFYLLRRCRVPARVAVATSVFVVAVTALVASTGHALKFVLSGGDSLGTVLQLVVITIPGVLIGGQVGSSVASRIPQNLLERALGTLFIMVALLMLSDVLI